jgi:hypothetical protein
MKQQYSVGAHKVQCDICPKVRRNTEMRMQWDGLNVCASTCWSPKHPNEYPRQVPNDGLPVANARPRVDISLMPQTQLGGITTWEDTDLMWETPTWYWDDDLSLIPLTDLIR